MKDLRAELQRRFQPLPGAIPAWHGRVSREEWRAWAVRLHGHGARLIALWGTDRRSRTRAFEIHAGLIIEGALLWLTLAVEPDHADYPGLTDLFPAGDRMQRALADMLGVVAVDAEDTRPWLRHGAWPPDWYPLRADADVATVFDRAPDAYPFVTVTGEGVHEIPVGPVHAGTIEPGHFRFSVLGERILRLEERLGYKHKAIEKLMEGRSLTAAVTLAGRVSGDSTVAYAWACAQAVETATATEVPARASWLRALLLERERIANHLGDLGALGNDAGFAFALAQFSAVKERWLRVQARIFGHRYLMDSIVPGGIAMNIDATAADALIEHGQQTRQAVRELRSIIDDHAGVQDRFLGTGLVAPELALRMGACGMAARASGQTRDLRRTLPAFPYDRLDVAVATHAGGDVAARVFVRFEEILESLSLCERILGNLPTGPVRRELAARVVEPRAVGCVEGWRGEVLIAVESSEDGHIERLHAHDPSWQNWPLLEHAVIGNIVPDFPLINKSFNLSYSGHDL
jgi:Ni,Fe-hydrogenase III large subunit/Ni,Fe-hydrogenase III component G